MPPESGKPYVPRPKPRPLPDYLKPRPIAEVGIVNVLSDYLQPPPELGVKPFSEMTAAERRAMLEPWRRGFLNAVDKLRPSSDGVTVLFDPDADLYRTWDLAGHVFFSFFPSWPEETPLDHALSELADTTGRMLMNPTAETVDAWQRACTEHDALLVTD